MSEVRDELDPPFEVLDPKTWKGPVLFNSPHSGSTYPRDFLASCRLDIAALRRSEPLEPRRNPIQHRVCKWYARQALNLRPQD